MNTEAKQRVDATMAQLVIRYPWWASLALQLERREASERECSMPLPYGVPTAATDGFTIVYNPQFILRLSTDDLLFTLAHETAHCVLMHVTRRGGRHPMKWNIAADQVVNAVLAQDGLAVPKGCIPPGPLDKTTEELYDDVQGVLGDLDIRLPGEFGGEAASSTTSSSRACEARWRSALKAAASSMPDTLRRLFEAAQEPEIDWRDVLARWTSARIRADVHTWSRPNRRYAGSPGWARTPTTTVAVCIDTSGSVGPDELAAFMTEARAVADVYGTRVLLMSADSTLHEVIEPGDEWPATLTGGGGTSFVDALARAVSYKVDGIVYLTDGEGDYPAREPDVPVLWVLTASHAEPPFGERVTLCRS